MRTRTLLVVALVAFIVFVSAVIATAQPAQAPVYSNDVTFDRTSSASPFIATAVVPVPVGVDFASLRLHQGGRAVPAQMRVAASTRAWQLVEVAALLERTTLPFSREVALLVSSDEPRPPLPADLALYDRALLGLISSPVLRFEVVLRDGSTWRSDPAASNGVLTWLGPYRAEWRTYHRTPVGSLVAFWTLEANSPTVDLAILWTNGDLPPAGDALLRSIRLRTPRGWTWSPSLPDPACVPPALVYDGRHAILSRGERAFRVVIHRESAVPPRPFDSLGVADWTGGGWLAAGFRAPRPPASGDHGLSAALYEERQRLHSAAPTAPGGPAPARAWPLAGVQYGGMTSGLWIEQAPGIRAAAARSADGARLAAVESLMWRARHPGGIYPGGEAILPEDHVARDGTARWRMFDLRFERVGGVVADPFGWSSLPALDPDLATWCPYVEQIRGWSPNDSQHLVRAFRSTLVLAWLAADDLALEQLASDAATSRMQLWPGAGPAHRLEAPPTDPDERHQGGSWGRSEGWAAVVVASDLAWTRDLRRAAANRAWLEAWVAYLEAVQLPTGMLSAGNFGKMFTDPPFNSRWWVHRGNEQFYLLQGLVAAWRAGVDDALPVAQRLVDGLWLYASIPGTGGVMERYPAGPLDGPRWTSRAQIPPELLGQIAADQYQTGSLGAFAAMTRASFGGWQVLDYAARPKLRAARDAMRGWGSVSPIRSGSLIETWGPTLAELEAALRP